MHKFVVKTVYGDEFGPFKSDNPYNEHKDDWGRAPKELETKFLHSKIIKAASAFYTNSDLNGKQVTTVFASPDYWIEIQKER